MEKKLPKPELALSVPRVLAYCMLWYPSQERHKRLLSIALWFVPLACTMLFSKVLGVLAYIVIAVWHLQHPSTQRKHTAIAKPTTNDAE